MSEPIEDDFIGREIVLDNRRYVIERISEISGDVSMRDVTFQNQAGIPINRVEKMCVPPPVPYSFLRNSMFVLLSLFF